MTRLADQDARDVIRHALAETLVVEAAAGTGKTTELVARVLGLLASGAAKLSALVAVTFTEKAAGEMKLRLRGEIERERQTATPEVRAHLELALSELEVAHIGTIHAFCAELLRERPVEARVDPLFLPADDAAQERLFEEAFDRWFQRTLSDPPEGVRRVLRKRYRDRDSGGPRLLLRKAGRTLVEQRDFDAPWRRDPFDRKTEIDAVLERIRSLAPYEAAAKDKDWWLAKSLTECARFLAEIERREAVSSRDYDGLEEELRSFCRQANGWGWKGGGYPTWGGGFTKQTVLDARDQVHTDLEAFLDRADADLAACLHADLRPLVDEYVSLQKKAGRVDFLDLLVVARDLLAKDAQVRGELQRRFTHVLVDEFQDTDPLQAEILLLLSADDPAERDYHRVRPIAGKLFVVGDPKQSIYRFRRADVVLYDRIKRQLVAAGARVVNLSTSFRSAPSIQSAINAAFAPLMVRSEDGSQPDYVALQPFRPDPVGRPTIIALPVPKPYSKYTGKLNQWAITESVPDAVGAFVDWLLNKSGWTVTERDAPDRPVPIVERHVCLLFKRFVSFREDVTRPYVRALEQRRIGHVLVGGRSFHQREEVVALRTALAAIEWPDDELSVFATLHGPFFALPDDALLAYRHASKTLNPMRKGKELDALTTPVADALAILAELHRKRNRRPIADTLSQLLERTRAHAGIAIWPTGAQALANLMRLLESARRFESSGATSFRAFLRHLDAEEERGGGAEAPVVEEGEGGVRFMTVHKAKGLEFPVVILVDPACPLAQREPSRFVDSDRRLWAAPLGGCSPVELTEQRERVLRHDKEEAQRLVYVAATRARELLVVPAVGDEPMEGWVSVLNPALYPNWDDRRVAQPAPGCPAFGADSVRDRGKNEDRSASSSVHPGQHTAKAGGHAVVWWDPFALTLEASDDAGLRQQKILAVDEASKRDQTSEKQHAEWKARREATVTRGALPLHAVGIVSKLGGDVATDASIEVTTEQTTLDRQGRPHGKSFGVLVHAILSAVDLAGGERVHDVAATYGRMLDASPEEVAWAERSVRAALEHPILRLASTSEHRREAPVSFRAADGTLVEGVLDLALREPSGWIIVDFKTDREVGDRAALYVAQVRRYAEAVRAATGLGVRGVLLSV